MSESYLKISEVKKLAHASGRRVSAEFLTNLNLMVKEKIQKACDVHNGGKKTLDASVAAHVGACPKGIV